MIPLNIICRLRVEIVECVVSGWVVIMELDVVSSVGKVGEAVDVDPT
jgi:hypothetical protein